MQFRESRKRQTLEIRHVFPVAPGEQRKNVAALIIPGAARRTRFAAGNHTEAGKRRRADEALVGIDIVGSRMIDGEQPDLIEVDGLFHRLHKTETENAVARPRAPGGNFQIFVGIGNVALVGSYPMADDAGTNHVGNEFVLVSVPGKQNGAGAAAAVELGDLLKLARLKVDFVLGNARGPKQAHHVGVLLAVEADEDRRGVLAEITGGAGYFPLLIERTGEDLDLCADGALVVVQRLQIDLHPVVATGAFVAKKQRSSIRLSDEKIRAAGAADISNGHGAGLQ